MPVFFSVDPSVLLLFENMSISKTSVSILCYINSISFPGYTNFMFVVSPLSDFHFH